MTSPQSHPALLSGNEWNLQNGSIRTIGILGGMSAASTLIYHKILCELTQQTHGGPTSPELLVRSLNFAPLAAYMESGDWASIARILNDEAGLLRDGAAEVIVLASNMTRLHGAHAG